MSLRETNCILFVHCNESDDRQKISHSLRSIIEVEGIYQITEFHGIPKVI
jgi:hypothetical protein